MSYLGTTYGWGREIGSVQSTLEETLATLAG